jgi:hypothetical protein
MPSSRHTPRNGARDVALVSHYAVAREKLTAGIRTLYEETSVPVREIARLAGVSDRALYQLARRHQWRLRAPLKGCHRRTPLPKQRLPHVARTRLSVGSASARRAVRNLQRAAAARRKVRTVAAELEANAAAIYARRKAEAELCALASIGRALVELVRLETATRTKADARVHADDAASAEAAELEARRGRLARMIAGLPQRENDMTAPAASEANPDVFPTRIRLLSD